ncbi:MAG: ATP synthase F1 subunit delta [Vampirovibrionales bacterium]|nr:ATP synthase F1 subunit delta [Vampirovibrionales bacterium]
MPKLLDNQLASRYAKAVFSAALEHDCLDAVREDLDAVASVMRDVPQLAPYFANPATTHADKEAFVQAEFVSKVNPWVGNLLKIMVENARMAILPQVAEQFAQLLNQHRNIATAEVMSAVELDDKQLERLQKTLEARFGFSRVELHNRVEPGILGGAIVKIQDQIIDGSFSGKLENLKKQFA